jgi:hypothetical protein
MAENKFDLIRAAIASAANALPKVTFGGMEFRLRPFVLETLSWTEAMSIGKKLAEETDGMVEGALTLYVVIARLLLNSEDGRRAFDTIEEIAFFVESAQLLPLQYAVLYQESGLKEYIENIKPSKTDGPKLTDSEVAEKN